MSTVTAPEFSLSPAGDFSLSAAAAFAEGFPGTRAQRASGELRFAWPVDDDWRTAGVALREEGGAVHATLELAPGTEEDLLEPARRDVERILSLDVDGRGFTGLAERDPVVGALQRRFPGLRPVLFYSPYEAAAWAIVGQRIRMSQAAAIRQRLATELGERGAFPAPGRLAGLTGPQRGLTQRKVEQLRALGAAALDGRLGRDRLRAMAPGDALEELLALPGIGPFSAELILIRGVGAPDFLPRHERRFARAAATAYGLPDDAGLDRVAEGWRPFRAWVALLVRAGLEAGPAPAPA